MGKIRIKIKIKIKIRIKRSGGGCLTLTDHPLEQIMRDLLHAFVWALLLYPVP